MAAIIQPRRTPAPSPRPALRLVPAGGGRPIDVPVELGLSTVHLVAAVVGLVVVLVLSLAIGNGTLAALAPAPSSAGAPAAAAATGGQATVVAQAGDTMWSIARRLQPTGDVRPLVDALVAANGGTALRPGQEVVVPR